MSPTYNLCINPIMKYYKIWTEIEEIDEENDTYIDQENPLSVTEVKTYKEAIRIQYEIHENYYQSIDEES